MKIIERTFEHERLVKRHIRKLLERIQPLPDVIVADIKRQLWYLSDDIKSMANNEIKKSGKEVVNG